MPRISPTSERCPRCKVILRECICSTIPRLETRTKVVLVAHRRELLKPTATGPLALECLPNSALYSQGERDQRIDLTPLSEEGRRLLCLYPADDARVLSPELVAKDPRPVTLIVPDGTWSQASRIVKRVPGIDRAERVILPAGRPTEWGIRSESKLAGLATFEAIARGLALIEGEHVTAPLERVFGAMVQATIAARGYAPALHQSATEHVAGSSLPEIQLLYADEHIALVNKPSGVIVHRGWSNEVSPLLQRVAALLGRRVYPVHRLDRATSGVVLFALSSDVARLCQELFTSRAIDKQYLALSRGRRFELGAVDHPLAEEGKPPEPAITDVRLLAHAERYGLYEVHPRTGRTHQIRRHFKHLHQPLIGDTRYGTGEHNRHFRERYGFHRLALHASSLAFPHPVTGQRLVVAAPLPDELRQLFSALGVLEAAEAVTPSANTT